MIQSELAAMANGSPLIRSYLGIPAKYDNLDIVKITDNSVHFDMESGLERAVFFTKRKFRDDKTTNHMIRLIEEGVFERAFKTLSKRQGARIWEAYYSRKLMPTKEMGRMAFLTAYPDAGTGGDTCDGAVYRQTGSEATWAALRAGAGTAANATDTDGVFAQFTAGSTADMWLDIVRSIFTFNLSSLSGTVREASFFCSSSTPVGNFGSSLVLTGATPASNSSLASSDFSQLGSSALSDTRISVMDWGSAEHEFPLSPSSLAALSPSVVAFGLRTDFDLTGDAPVFQGPEDQEYYGGYFADYGSNEPRLEVTLRVGKSLLLRGVG